MVVKFGDNLKAISPDPNDDYRFIETKSWLKNIAVGVAKNGCGISGHRTLKLAVSLEGIN